MKKKRVIIDTDPGIDDALALILAFRSPELDVEAVTVVFGNAGVDICARNAAYVLSLLDLAKERPVLAVGEAAPLIRDRISAAKVHGEDGLGNVFKSKDRPQPSSPDELGYPPCEKSAPELIVSLLRRNPGQFTIIALGPLTNLARAVAIDKAAILGAAEIISMGGAFSVPGNITPKAEFNYYCDPHAASEVLGLGARLTVVPLDATQQVRLTPRHLEKVPADKRDKVASFTAEISSFLMTANSRTAGYRCCYLHDPLAVGAAIDPSLLAYRESALSVCVEKGPDFGRATAMGPGAGAPTGRYCCDAEAERFLELFVERTLGFQHSAANG